MKHLFVDDERVPNDVTWIRLPDVEWDIVRTQNEFEVYITANGVPDCISFDNDLGTDNGEGRWCARWMVDQILDGCIDFNPRFHYYVHSRNIVAQNAIPGLLDPFIDWMKRDEQP